MFAHMHGKGQHFRTHDACKSLGQSIKTLTNVNRVAMPQVDNRSQEEPLVTAKQAIALCDRNFGIGGDGVRFCILHKCRKSAFWHLWLRACSPRMPAGAQLPMSAAAGSSLP